MRDKYLLVSFDDARIKSISEILGNSSCKKILDLLAERKAGETDISRELGMPLNTVGYNIKKLLEAGLIEKAEHFWSIKGKKMPVYKVSNKSIVISPKRTIASKLGGVIPAVLITGAAALFIRFFSLNNTVGLQATKDNALESASVASTSEVTNLANISLVDKLIGLPAWSWFLIGALFVLVVYFLLNLTRRSKI